jgi:hypothetical protein
MEITFDLDTTSIGKLPTNWQEAKARGLNESAQTMVRFLQTNSPVDHGLLKQWFIDSIDDEQAVIKSPAEYAVFVDQGTRPHWIEPREKKALHWEGTGTFYAGGLYHSHGYGGFSKGHIVGGIQGRHFVDQSFNELRPLAPGYFLRALEEVQG